MEELKYPYIRVGTSYYKRIKKPLLSGDFLEILAPWSLEIIKQDYGRKWSEVFDEIPKFDGFTNIPAHSQYSRMHHGFYNKYEPLPCKPAPGSFTLIESFLKHLFQEQFTIALDYLTLLYQKPTEPLPILCLVSKERGTGKTTFLNLLKGMFGLNMTYNNNEDFRSVFNDSWVNKLIIAVDEVLLDRREDSERIKNLSTAKSYKAEAKGKSRIDIEFFGKFVLCSNNEEDFIKIDPAETRYWVRKVEPLEKSDPFMLERMKNEIPAFLHFLSSRKITSEKKTRMWFEEKLLETPALLKVKRRFRNKQEMELLEIIQEIMDAFELEELHFTNKDAIEWLGSYNIRVTRSEVKGYLENWGLPSMDNSYNYTTYKYNSVGNLYEDHHKGRYYILKRSDLTKILMI